MKTNAENSERCYAVLHQTLPNSNVRMADHISSSLRTIDDELTEQIAATESHAIFVPVVLDHGSSGH